jgi:tetratricopeptide (TPR) repeat protein
MSDYSSNLNASSYPKRNWYLTVLIVGSTLFAVGGVVRALFYGPVHARWLVAHAANELAAQRVDSAVSWLDKAYSASSDIASDSDYWRLRFEILSGKKPLPSDELDQFVNEAIESINKDADQFYKTTVASKLSRLLFNDMYFKHALLVLEKTLPPLEDRTPSENNEIAYTRSIAGQDLDMALTEINRSLQDRNTNQFSQLFDTKAWILHKKGDSEKAIKFADAAVKEWYKEIAAANANYALLLLPDDKFTLTKKDNEPKIDSPFLEENPETAPPKRQQPTPANRPNSQPESNDPFVTLDTFLSKYKIDPVQSSKEPNRQPVEKATDFASELPLKTTSVGRDRGSLLHTTAVLRYHRACILEDLNKTAQAQKDYYWLDAFGYTNTDDLY